MASFNITMQTFFFFAQMKNRCVQLCYVTWLPGELRSGNICRGIYIYEKKIIHLFFTVTLHLLWERQAQTTTVLQPFSHSLGPDWGKAIWLPDHLYTALSGNGFSDSDLFFCAYALCLHCEDSGKRERGREGEKKKKQVWPKPSQLSPRCLTEVIVSDRGSSHEPWTETGWN